MTDLAADCEVSTELEPWWAGVWERHSALYEAQAVREQPADEQQLRRELLFCLLGGHGVTFELSMSATDVLAPLQPFHKRWTREGLRVVLEAELNRPQFEPRRRDGSLRRYRFPARKSEIVAAAAAWVREQGELRSGLEARATEVERREWLCQCPGVGMKTASWLLRNSGWARRLAILDVHLLRALAEAQVVEAPSLPRDYRRVESAYLAWAARLGACPAALDLFLWDVQRAQRAAAAVG